VAFDLHAPTFRHKMYDAYKAGRRSMDEELQGQMAPAKAILSAMGYEILSLEGYEADDILGTIAQRAAQSGDRCYILTGDRDSLQLIDQSTGVLLISKGETVLYDEARFFEKYGIFPHQFVDAKALMGDQSDNIPGVPGVGEKTALPLIAAFGDLDSLYEHLEDPSIKAGVRKKLADFKESAYLSRDLARIYKDVPLPLSFERKERSDALYGLLAELEFSSFITRLGVEPAGSEAKSYEKREYLPATAEKLLSLEGRMAAQITSGGDLKIATEKEYLQIEQPDDAFLAAFFEEPLRRIAVYDCKSLYRRFFARFIYHFKASEDPMLLAYVHSAIDGDYSLSALCLRYLGLSLEDGEDPALILELTKKIEGLLSQEELRLYKEVELPTALVLARCEEAGILLDREGLARFSLYLQGCIAASEEEIYRLAGERFNINSPKQLSEILFEKLSLPVLKKTKSGYSTNAEVLEKLRPYHPIIDGILEYRQLAKLRSTYAEGLLKVAGEDGRVHTCFTQTVTATGRLSSVEPNLQNIPVRTELGRELRRFFIAPKGRVLLDADYSQIELRLLAHVSGDQHMIAAFLGGEDIHTATAAKVFHTPVEQVTADQRKSAKAVNFGIVYGISAFSLADDLKVSRKEADDYIKSYFATYGGIERYLKETVETAKKEGYVSTMLGRKRFIPELTSGKGMLKKFGERVAMNSPIQGSAADIIKIAMVRVDSALKEADLDARLILQVHDELIVEAAEADADAAAKILKREMEGAVSLQVPLTVELNRGKSWFDCK
jgi:DNA polymerase-1